MAEKLRVVLYTKRGCGLCEKMKIQMRNAGVEELYTLEEVDIENDAELFSRYRDDIPVLCVAGVEAFRHRLTVDDFRNYITSCCNGD
ncbi:MAG TPA: glutaredoxin family protein [Pyrinomonadaceae bacterium]|nr:glutaredoxin family protein [Pyrinomonadaceae bacterium]